jgi:cell division septation protein DedD
MTPEPRPAAEAFDPGSGELPPSLERVLIEADKPILLLVAAEADDLAARAAIALAEARATRGRATVLADADLDAPRLHGQLEVENLEGLVDVFLFGASLRRVAVRPRSRHFAFAPAGAYSPDPAEVLQSPRWDRIAEELTGEDALLLVFLPAAAPGARQLSRRVRRAIILGDDRAVERAAARLDATCRIVAAVDPTPPLRVGPGGAPEPVASEAPVATTRERKGPELDEPIVIRPERRSRRVSPVLLIALALALAAAAWFGYRELFGREAPPAAQAAAVQPTGPADPGAPVETTLPYSVAVAAYQDLETAAERVDQLARAEPDLGFYLSPVAVHEDVFYRLLAGPVRDRESAVAVMQRLVDAEHKQGMDEWALLLTAHTFHLGDYEGAGEAEGRVQELADAGIPAYVVPQRYQGGQYRYRVYGGAYQNEAEAEVMREMLENAGEATRLIVRVGEPVG